MNSQSAHRRWPAGLILTLAVAASACGAKRPVVYPNERARQAGDAGVQADIDDCLTRAKQYGASSGAAQQAAGSVAGQTAVGAGTGAAVGAVGGAIYGDAGRGAAAGAATGATAGLLHGIFGAFKSGGESDPVYQNFVDRCLREKGYEPIGWK
jgi:predicted small lipoprotein YifL